ncbi:response regulator [Candidatus Woesearchaeota archaeon]|nr:response regulator [Candidatus Woesearchaeota archaeon]
MAKIILADDHKKLVDDLTKIIRMLGHDVTTVPDGTDLVEKLAEALPNNKYDLIISDLRMKWLSGMDVFMYLKEKPKIMIDNLIAKHDVTPDQFAEAYQDTPKVLFTGTIFSDTDEEIVLGYVDKLISKPRIDKLKKYINDLFKNS